MCTIIFKRKDKLFISIFYYRSINNSIKVIDIGIIMVSEGFQVGQWN